MTLQRGIWLGNQILSSQDRADTIFQLFISSLWVFPSSDIPNDFIWQLSESQAAAVSDHSSISLCCRTHRSGLGTPWPVRSSMREAQASFEFSIISSLIERLNEGCVERWVWWWRRGQGDRGEGETISDWHPELKFYLNPLIARWLKFFSHAACQITSISRFKELVSIPGAESGAGSGAGLDAGSCAGSNKVGAIVADEEADGESGMGSGSGTGTSTGTGTGAGEESEAMAKWRGMG